MVRVHHRPLQVPRPVLAIALVGFALALIAALVLRSDRPEPSLPKDKAEQAALANPEVKAFLRKYGWDSVGTLPLDQTHWRVTFTNGHRTVLDVSVDEQAVVEATEEQRPGSHRSGSSVLWSKPALIGFTLLFIVATAVTPLRRMRNLDAAVIGGVLLVSLLLYDARLVTGEAYAGAVLLAYVLLRCAWVGFSPHAVTADERPLMSAITGDVHIRVPRIVLAGVAIAALVLTVTATGISDVGFAGLAGATVVQHGEVPYGHITSEIVHGDTYPLFSYMLYLPFTLISPVRDSFDNLDGSLWLNAITLLVAAALAFRVGRNLAEPDNEQGGLLMALAWLACPAVLLAASGGGNDVPTAVFVMAALALATRARASTIALSLAAAAKVGPLGALAVWVAAHRGRARVEGIAIACLVVGLLTVAGLVLLDGTHAVSQMIDALSFQFQRGTFHSVWQQLSAGPAQALFQALVVAFAIVAVGVAASGSRLTLRRTCALAGAVLAGIQLAANYWTFAYFVWVLPFILVALFPPLPLRSPPPARGVP